MFIILPNSYHKLWELRKLSYRISETAFNIKLYWSGHHLKIISDIVDKDLGIRGHILGDRDL